MTALPPAPPGLLEFQARFDPVDGGPETQGLGDIRYLDTGPIDGSGLVFFGGIGTSARACLLTEFARTTRERLGLRLISVERNGLGETPFQAGLGYADAAVDVLAVLGELGVDRFGIVAISGGGPFAAALAAAVPERVVSLHLAAAAAGAGAPLSVSIDARDPRALWEFPLESPVHRIPGFARAAGDEGVRALGPRGERGAALAHEGRLLRETSLPDLRAVHAPAYLYWGSADEVVPPAHVELWRGALPNVVASRCYEGEGHDVQYRHWDQILIDASGMGDRVLVCQKDRARLVSAEEVPGDATLGLCCWNPSMTGVQ